MASVLYDGSCPLCAREIAMYRRQTGAEAICWLDITQIPNSDIPSGLTRNEVLARFHFIRDDGSHAVGAVGFVELWKTLPNLKFLGRLAGSPPVLFILECAYKFFLRIRPAIPRFLCSQEVDLNERS